MSLIAAAAVVHFSSTKLKQRRPNCCGASLLPSPLDSTLFWYDLILFICHFIGALILIHTYYFVIFFLVIVNKLHAHEKERTRNSIQKVTHKTFVYMFELNVYTKHISFIWCVYLVTLCLFPLSHTFSFVYFFLDIHQRKKWKIALIYDCIGRFALVSFEFFFVRIEWETGKYTFCGFCFMVFSVPPTHIFPFRFVQYSKMKRNSFFDFNKQTTSRTVCNALFYSF